MTLRKVYVDACQLKRVTPNEPEWHEWKKVFGQAELRDVQAALSLHWQDTREDEQGRKKGSFFPSVADLKPLVFRAKAQRERDLTTPQDLVAFQCPECKLGCCRLMYRGEEKKPPQCRRCNAVTVEVHRSESSAEPTTRLPDNPEADKRLIESLKKGIA